MTLAEVRKKYLDFFADAERRHKIIPSASLVPENDSTTLFTGSGMQPMVPYLLGQKHPAGRRLADSQKCFRAEDIEEVGDNRHTTFFEMLGNWSLGDYWKEDQLKWVLEFLTKEIGIPKDKLWVTCFAGDKELGIPEDTESVEIWKKLGIPESRIKFYGSEKNWWSRSGPPATMPAGEPGGPDSEMFYEFTRVEHDPKFGKECHPNCDCGRFMEIGNSVFMEYKKKEDGTFEKLAQRNVDFGGGLERITAAANDEPDVFKIDIFRAMGEALVSYRQPNNIRKIRIILDHMRASINLITSGIEPSNKERGYVLRRILRRSILHVANLAGQDATIPIDQRPSISWNERHKEIIGKMISEVINFSPELGGWDSKIRSVIAKETGQFIDLLKSNSELQNTLRKYAKSKIVPGEEVFMLFSTHGLPIDYIKDEAKKTGLVVDEAGYAIAMAEHQEKSRTASAGMFKGGLADSSEKTTRLHTAHHLLLKALQMVLGPEVKQRGSNITQERLRMDFSYDGKMTEEQKKEAERIVNEKIAEDLPVIHSEMDKEEAEKLGAEHEFGQKYPDRVSIYSIGPKEAAESNPRFKEAFSIEFCGGPHVKHTGEIGLVRITKEEAVGAGTRRIRAVVE